MHKYETLFVLQPGLSEEKVDEVVTTFESIIPETSGKHLKTDKWGKRKLAYRIGQHWEGWYIRYEFEGDGAVQRELERRMGISDDVIRHLTTRVDPRMEAEHARAAERERRSDGDGPGSSDRREGSDSRRGRDDDRRPSSSDSRRREES